MRSLQNWRVQFITNVCFFYCRLIFVLISISFLFISRTCSKVREANNFVFQFLSTFHLLLFIAGRSASSHQQYCGIRAFTFSPVMLSYRFLHLNDLLLHRTRFLHTFLRPSVVFLLLLSTNFPSTPSNAHFLHFLSYSGAVATEADAMRRGHIHFASGEISDRKQRDVFSAPSLSKFRHMKNTKIVKAKSFRLSTEEGRKMDRRNGIARIDPHFNWWS